MKHTTEDLLQLLEVAPDNQPDKYIDDDVYNFVVFYNLHPGDNIISTKAIYNLYKKWSKNPLKKQKFIGKLINYLPLQSRNNLKINESVININRKIFELIKSDPTVKVHNKQVHFQNYLEKYNLTPGHNFVNINTLFHLYHKWVVYINKKGRFNKAILKKFLRIFFKEKTNHIKTWYGINFSKLDEETMKKIIELENEKETENKKTKK